MPFYRDDSGTWWTIGIIAALGVGGYFAYNEIKKGNFKFSDIGKYIANLLGRGSSSGGTGTGGTGTGTGTGGSTDNPTGTTVAAFVGDVGSGRNDNWKKVFAAMKAKTPDVIGIAGDMSYSDAAAFKPVTDEAKTFAKVVYGAMGNHDGSGYADQFTAFSNSVQNYGNMSIMLLDTDDGAASVTFAKANFAKMTNKWKIVMFHKPIFVSPNSNHSADEGKIKALVPEFVKAGINLVVQAHVHALEKRPGYVLVGGGGESHYKFTGKDTGVIFQNDSSFGFLLVTCTPTEMKLDFISDAGTVLDSSSITTAIAARARANYEYVIDDEIMI